MKFENLNHIGNEEYFEKMNGTVIDGIAYKHDRRFTINKFLNKQKRKTTILKFNSRVVFYHAIADHINDLTIPIKNGKRPNSITCRFCTPYSNIKKVREDIEEIRERMKQPFVDFNYKIYLVNPLLYHYQMSNTIPIAFVKNLDTRSSEGKTDYSVSCINDYMIEATGEPLFYLV